jgi:antitoxin YefM
MATETTYTSLRQNLASVLDQVVDQQETVIVRRKGARRQGARDVALLPAAELAGLIETAHLLRSPRNAHRLLAALHRAELGKVKSESVLQLRKKIFDGTGA